MATTILYGEIDHTSQICDICGKESVIGVAVEATRTTSNRKTDFKMFLCQSHHDIGLASPRMLKARADCIFDGIRLKR